MLHRRRQTQEDVLFLYFDFWNCLFFCQPFPMIRGAGIDPFRVKLHNYLYVYIYIYRYTMCRECIYIYIYILCKTNIYIYILCVENIYIYIYIYILCIKYIYIYIYIYILCLDDIYIYIYILIYIYIYIYQQINIITNYRSQELTWLSLQSLKLVGNLLRVVAVSLILGSDSVT